MTVLVAFRLRRPLRGFTLVELLVVITIIGILMGLLLPAVQSSREAGRQAQCRNNLKQISLACLEQESTHGSFPSSGFGWAWIGDPDLGYGRTQPGGWAYSILPGLEQQVLHDMAMGQSAAQKLATLAQMAAIPVSIFYCPTRRTVAPTPRRNWTMGSEGLGSGGQQAYNANVSDTLARSDYAANAGDAEAGWGSGPAPAQALAGQGFQNTSGFTGVFYQCSQTTTAEITDGTSNTYLVGEKYLNPQHYLDGQEYSDDQSCWSGDDWDLNRWTTVGLPPLQDRSGLTNYYCFGSAHTSGWNVSFCDGSVRTESYSIDPKIHDCLGNRMDGVSIGSGNF